MIVALLGHNDGSGVGHMGRGSVWMVISMVAFSLFLLGFAWSLLRPSRQPQRTPADIATERYARGEIDADEFERILGDIESHRR